MEVDNNAMEAHESKRVNAGSWKVGEQKDQMVRHLQI